jgi:DNA-binding GntR family transcriptional regulator
MTTKVDGIGRQRSAPDTTEPDAVDNQHSARKPGRGRINSYYQILRDRICFFDYPPGMVIREAQLAEEFGVSRTPIRQILQRLEVERLVDIRDGVGTIVTGVEFDSLGDVYDLRLRLTEMIADLSPRPIGADAHRRIESLIERAARVCHGGDLREFWLIESERHRLLNDLIGNEVLREMHDRLYTQTSRVWYGIVEGMWPEAIGALIAELEELRRALVAGDIRAVAYTSRNFIAYSMVRFARHFKQSQD